MLPATAKAPRRGHLAIALTLAGVWLLPAAPQSSAWAGETSGTAAPVTVTAAPVSLPELSGRVDEVIATVTTDRRIRWSAEAQIVDVDAIHVVELHPMPTQEVLAPGTHRVVLGSTRLFQYLGRHSVRFRVLDPETRVITDEKRFTVEVRGRLAPPQRVRVTRHGSRLALRGVAHPFPTGVVVEIAFKRRGQARFHTIKSVRIKASGRWKATVKSRHAGAVRVRVASPYGVSAYTKPRRVAAAD